METLHMCEKIYMHKRILRCKRKTRENVYTIWKVIRDVFDVVSSDVPPSRSSKASPAFLWRYIWLYRWKKYECGVALDTCTNSCVKIWCIWVRLYIKWWTCFFFFFSLQVYRSTMDFVAWMEREIFSLENSGFITLFLFLYT